MKRSWVAVLICCIVVLLASQAAMADSVQIRGIVTDPAKKPVDGAQVIAVPEQQRYWHPEELHPLAKSKANADGEFSISVPTTGPVVLIGWGNEQRMTKFPVNPEAAQNRVVGLALDPGFTLKGTVVDGSSGEPIAGAAIGPLVAGLDTQTQRAMRVVPQWTTTDKRGEFQLQGLASDIDHTFLVKKDGYVITNAELSRGQGDISVKLDKGGSSVSGEIFARGEPQSTFSNVLIRANGNGFDVIERTDSQSRFTIDGLPGGTFTIEAIMLEGNRASKVETVEMPEDNGTSISLEVSGGYQISGTAIDMETNKPATGVSIGLRDHWTSSSTDGSFTLGPFFEAQQIDVRVPEGAGWQLAELVTGSEYDATDGFSDVNSVTVKVRRQRIIDLSLQNFEYTTAPVVVTFLHETGEAFRSTATTASVAVPVFKGGQYVAYATSGGMASEAKAVSIGLERSVPVSLTMQAGADVSGKLLVTNTDETTRVRTLRLALQASLGDKAGPALFLGTSPRPDGTFNLETMPNGHFLLSVSNRSGSHQTTKALTLVPGHNDLGEIIWEAGNQLAGEVRSASDMPIPYAHVGLLLPNEQVVHAETDEHGKFSFDDIYADVLPGLIVEAGSYALYREQDVSLPQTQMKIVMQSLGKLNVTIEAPAGTQWELHIARISRWASGTYAEQLVGNSVHMSDAMGGETVEVGLAEKGTFRAIAVSKATQEFRVSPAFEWAGEAATGQSVTLVNGNTGRITGSVSGASVPVEVTVINMAIPEQLGREKAEQTVSVANGRFQATDLPPGNYMILGHGETYSSYLLNVELRPGETATADLAPVEPMTAEGIVQFSGEPLPQAKVQLLSETDPSFPQQTTTTDAEGLFTFPGLLPDTYSISATYQSESGELTVRKSLVVSLGDPPAAITLDLTPPKPVLFTVDPALGLSVGTDVNLMSKETRQLTRARWVNGQLEAQVSPGEYEVWLGDAVGGIAGVKDDGSGYIRKQ